MFKHLINIFVMGIALCCLNPAHATICHTSAYLTQDGQKISNLTQATQTGTITNLVLVINLDYMCAISNTGGVGHGDYCAITFASPNSVITYGTVSSQSDYFRITYKNHDNTVVSNCQSALSGLVENANPSAFNYHWPVWTGYQLSSRTGTVYAEAIFQLRGPSYGAGICNGSKVYIPLTVEYNLVSPNFALDPNMLYHVIGGCCRDGTLFGSRFAKNFQTPLNFTKAPPPPKPICKPRTPSRVSQNSLALYGLVT